MISDLLLNEIKNNLVEYKGDKLKMVVTVSNEQEEKFKWIIGQICTPASSWTPEENPFAYYKKTIDSEIVAALKRLLDKDLEDLFKAQIEDCLWHATRDYESAKRAFQYYCAYIWGEDDFDICFHIFNRVLDLYKIQKSEKNSITVSEVFNKCVRCGCDNRNAVFLKLLENTNRSNIVPEKELVKLAEEKLQYINELVSFPVVMGYFELIEDLYFQIHNIKKSVKPVQIKEINGIRRMKVNFLLELSNPYIDEMSHNTLQNIQHMKLAINILKGISDSENERKEILKIISHVEKKAIHDIPAQSYSMDISNIVNIINNEMDKLEKEESLCFLACYVPILKSAEVKNKVMENNQKYLFSHLFPVSLLDKNGKCKAHVPSMHGYKIDTTPADVLEANMENHVNIFYNIIGQAQVSSILYNINKFSIVEDDIQRIVSTSAFVPENRKKAFTKGILAGFQNDFITALSILIPQVENSVRQIAIECGDVVYNMKEDGTEELKTLNAILDLENISDCLDEDLQFNLKAIFCSKYSLNMRNELAHGIIDDNEFYSFTAVYTWWFIYKLCFTFCGDYKFNLIQKINKKLEK
ncbi:MAG: DUF4209 domain-containing protein [Mobilitalea sp.]